MTTPVTPLFVEQHRAELVALIASMLANPEVTGRGNPVTNQPATDLVQEAIAIVREINRRGGLR